MKTKVIISFFLLTSFTALGEAKAVCHESTRYLIVEGFPGGVGTDFVVKHKRNPKEKKVCKYTVEEGDFEIKNESGEYYLSLQGDALLLDSGTGPDRMLIIWDLKAKKKVYEGDYASETIEPDHIEFWTTTGFDTEKECPGFKAEMAGKGLGVAVETLVRIKFSDFSLVKSSETRCATRE